MPLRLHGAEEKWKLWTCLLYTSLSPLDKLNQGFSYVSDEKGKTVSDVDHVRVGDRLTVHVKNGRIEAQVVDKEKWKQEKGVLEE